MLHSFIELPEAFAESIVPILEVIGGLVALALVGVLISGLLALRMIGPEAVR
jgi:hypothetical protein